MNRRALGRTGITVSSIGLGCMGMSEFYGHTDEAEAVSALERALEVGIDFFDTADMYGPFTNEELLGGFLKGRRDRVVVATKFGIARSADPAVRGVDNRPEHIRASCEGSLKRLGIDVIDLFYVHRVDRQVPIEDTVGVLSELVQAGKVRAIGLSEVSVATLRRAHAVHPVAAVQSEYSLFTREPEYDGILDACRDLGVTFVAYSPLGRGLLTSAPPTEDNLAPDDFRRRIPRFQGDALEANLQLAGRVRELAAELKATPAQVALAWLLGDPIVVPIPGSRRADRVEENARAVTLQLSPSSRTLLNLAFGANQARGERSSPQGMSLLNG